MKFAKDYKDYKQDLDISLAYLEASILGITRATNLSSLEAEEFVKAQPEWKAKDEIKIDFISANRDGERTIKTMPIVDYLNKLGKSDAIITPTFTSFVSKEKKEAPHSRYLKMKMIERKAVKKAAAISYNAMESVRATVLTGIQNAIKIFINSFSGAARSGFNPFYSASLHQVLCAMCRCSTAIASSIIERLIAGIRFYHKPSLVSDDLLQTIQKYNRTEIIMAMNDLDLVYPSKQDCLDIIRRSYIDYWWELEKEDEFMPILDTMDNVERAAFCYNLDLFHLLKFNPVSIKNVLSDLSFNDFNSLDTNVPWIMDELSGDESNLIMGLIGDSVKGTTLRDNLNKGNPMRLKINALAHRLRRKLLKYKVLSDAFFLTDILPLDIGNQDNAIRYAVALGDTDSAIYTTMLINELYYGEAKFTPDQNPITELCIFFANGVIENGLGIFTGQMNVHPDDRYALNLKNEFRFGVLLMTAFKKTYFSSVATVEGAVLADDNPKYEIKSQRFHAGKANKEMVKELHDWMKAMPKTLENGEKIDRNELIDLIIGVEDNVLQSLDSKIDHKFATLKIKPLSMYSKPESQEWAKHLLWEYCYGKDLGSGGNDGYASYKLPLHFEGGLSNFIENASPKIKAGFNKYLDYVTKGDDSKRSSRRIVYIPIPLDVMRNTGIPDEIKPLIDLDKAIKSTLDPHLLTLSGLGITLFKKNKMSGDNVVLQKRLKDIMV